MRWFAQCHQRAGGTARRTWPWRLIQAAHEWNLLLIEDGVYSHFCYDTEPMPSLKSLEGGKRVIYLGSFAKTVFPGLRMGYVVAGQRVAVATGASASLADEMSKAKSLLSVNTPALMQAVVGGLLLSPGLQPA